MRANPPEELWVAWALPGCDELKAGVRASEAEVVPVVLVAVAAVAAGSGAAPMVWSSMVRQGMITCSEIAGLLPATSAVAQAKMCITWTKGICSDLSIALQPVLHSQASRKAAAGTSCMHSVSQSAKQQLVVTWETA